MTWVWCVVSVRRAGRDAHRGALATSGLRYNRSTRPRCARRPAPRCCPAATTTLSAWAASPRSPRRSRIQLACGPTLRAAGRDPAAERLSDRAVRQVPQGPVWETARRARSTIGRRRAGIRVLLRLHRRRDEPVVAGALREHDAGRADRTTREGYHFMTDMTDKAIGWMRSQKSLTPDKPFFMYFAPGATHAPHHVPKEWIDRYKGQFDQGWDKLREETLARQIADRRHPAGRQLTKRDRRDPGLGRDPDRQKSARPPDGGLRRLPRVHRPPDRPADRRRRATWARWTTRSSSIIIGDNGASRRRDDATAR